MSLMNGLRAWLKFRDWKIWQKLVCIAAPFLVPIVVLSYFVISANSAETTRANQESSGLTYLHPVRKVVQNMQQHRGLSNGLLSGNKAFETERATKQTEVDEAIREVDAMDQKLGGVMHTTDKWQNIKEDWQDLKGKVLRLKPQESFRLHTEIITKILSMVDDVAEYSTLLLDPMTDSYYIQDAMLTRLLPQTEYLGQVRAVGAAIAARNVGKPNEKDLTADEKTQLLVLQGQMIQARNALKRDLDNAIRYNPALKAKLDAVVGDNIRLTDEFLQILKKEIIDAEAITIAPNEYFTAATRAIDGGFRLYDTAEPSLDGLLQARAQSYSRINLYCFLGIGAGLVLSLAIAYLVVRGITGQIDSITGMFGQIGMGNFQARAEVKSSDELGAMAGSLNAMLDNTLSLMQSQEEKEQIQSSISKLLMEVSGVADGDLTKDAEVSTDVTGAIADSFNYMIEQLRKVISNVQDSTVQVSSSANEIHATAEHLASGTESQAEQIVNTSAAIDEMAVSIQQVSENAALSTNVAQQALQNAKQGTEAVYNTIDGMNRIRDQVQETAKRIKRLGESSQEIGQIIQLIDDIADRTSILALNASIQAAMAGDAGRGFAVVAEEVERLAVRSTDATKKIAMLVKTIQSETGEAVNAMEKGIKEVVDGSRLANQAGKSLTEIEGVSKQLADLIQSISLASKQQARGSEALAKSMGEISQITQQTAAGTKQAAVSVNGLASLADELRSSVSTFKLPGRAVHANGGPVPNGKTNGHASGKEGKEGKEGKRMLSPLPAAKLARS